MRSAIPCAIKHKELTMIQVFLQWLKRILGIGKKHDTLSAEKQGKEREPLVTKRLAGKMRRLPGLCYST